ncbi:hypothetical protein [Youxingia wuxianensis]|uniref:Uncharacterized protein n=1 Tax=Youxingia wuxianensis TaxID=2763678 RepID=A0A926ETW3_9FIRM|nr:hypothetical protein [Youxingia wuxianensis]MBC8586399.1 hypothetical protein [Youxingia wuxianensis]
MKRNQIQNIRVHMVPGLKETREERACQFHVQIIEQRINQMELSRDQKIQVVQYIIEILKNTKQ